MGHGQATISGSSTLRASDTRRKSIVIQNLGPGILYIGGAGVTSSNGFMLVPNSVISLETSASAPISVVNASGSCDVRYIEELLH